MGQSLKYRKPTNKNDYMHFYSIRDNKTQTGIKIGFYSEHLEYVNPNI